MFIPIFTVLLVFSHGLENNNVRQEIKVTPGLVFEPMGNTKIVKGYLDLHVDLSCSYTIFRNLDDLFHSLLSLNESFTKTSTYHDLIMIDLSRTPEQKLKSQHLLVAKQHVILTLSKINKLFQEPWIIHHRFEIPNNNNTKRNKRGYFDLGGQILHTIFGLATDGKVRKLENQIQLLSDYSAGTDILYSKLTEQLKYNNDKLKEAFLIMQKLDDFLVMIRRNEEFSDYLLQVSSFTNLADSYVQQIYNILNKVNHIMELASKFQTSFSLYNLNLLQSQIDKAKRELNLGTIIELESKTISQFLSKSWSRIDISSPYQITTLFPFVSSEAYHTYHLIPFPTTKLNNERIQYLPKDKFFFLDKTSLKYSFMSEQNFHSCLHDSNTNVCPFREPIHAINVPNCIVSLYTNNSFNDKIDNTSICSFIKITDKFPITVMIKDKFFISFDQPVKARLNCKNQMANDIAINNFYVLQPSCNIVTPNHHFQNPIHLQSNVILNKENNISFYPVTISIFNHSVIPILKSYPEIHFDQSLTNFNQTLDHHRFHLSYLPITSVTSTLCCIIILISISIYIIYRIKCKRPLALSVNDTHDQDIPTCNDSESPIVKNTIYANLKKEFE